MFNSVATTYVEIEFWVKNVNSFCDISIHNQPLSYAACVLKTASAEECVSKLGALLLLICMEIVCRCS